MLAQQKWSTHAHCSMCPAYIINESKRFPAHDELGTCRTGLVSAEQFVKIACKILAPEASAVVQHLWKLHLKQGLLHTICSP